MDFEQLLMDLLGVPRKAAGEPAIPPAAQIGSLRNPGLYEADPGTSRVDWTLETPQAVSMPDRPRVTDPTFSDVVGPGDPQDLMTILRDNQNDPAVDAEVQALLAPAQEAWGQERQGYERDIANSQNDAEFLQELLNRPGGGPGAAPQGPSLAERPYINASAGATTPYPTPPAPAANPLANPSTAFAHLDRGGGPLRPVGPQRTVAAPPVPPPTPGPSAPQFASLDSPGQGFTPNPAPTAPPVNLAATPPGRPGWMDAPIGPMPQNPIIGANPGGPYQTFPPPDPFGAPGNTPPPMQPAPVSPDREALRRVASRLLPFDANRPAALQLSEAQAAGRAPILSQPQAPTPAATPWRLPDSVMAPLPNRPAPTAGLRRQPPAPTAPTAAPAPLQSDILNRQELQRFLDANPMMPDPATPAQPTVASPQSPPIPPAAQAQNPVPAPSPGQAMPTALKEQLLAEALRLTQQRRTGGSAPLPTR